MYPLLFGEKKARSVGRLASLPLDRRPPAPTSGLVETPPRHATLKGGNLAALAELAPEAKQVREERKEPPSLRSQVARFFGVVLSPFRFWWKGKGRVSGGMPCTPQPDDFDDSDAEQGALLLQVLEICRWWGGALNTKLLVHQVIKINA